jgi:transcriptional regulator with XRE-family HTH domain
MYCKKNIISLPPPFMENINKERLLDAPEVYYRLRETISMLQMNNTELGEKFNISRTYIQKILSGNAAISGSAIKAFISGGLDVHYIFTGRSDREEIKKLNAEIRTLKDLIREAYSGE